MSPHWIASEGGTGLAGLLSLARWAAKNLETGNPGNLGNPGNPGNPGTFGNPGNSGNPANSGELEQWDRETQYKIRNTKYEIQNTK